MDRVSFIPRPRKPKIKPRRSLRDYRGVLVGFVLVGITGVAALSFPSVLAIQLARIQDKVPEEQARPAFPVTVDPERKLIVEDPTVDALFEDGSPLFSASAASAPSVFERIALLIADSSLYQSLGASAIGGSFVSIQPGTRREEVADRFAKGLRWTNAERKEFLQITKTSPTALTEGMYTPGVYLIEPEMTPAQVHMLIRDRFEDVIGSRYSNEIAEKVPLIDALTIASLIEKEAAGADDMRLISGIIWNRLFKGMNLQIDATLQYAKGNQANQPWWPKVVPNDKYIKSPYNTYKYEGLPPAPIANPSVATVLAALNPKNTDCMFYFHDKYGRFHCSVDYKGHVALLKKYYGQGR